MRRFKILALLLPKAAFLRRSYGTPAIPQIVLDQLKLEDDIGRSNPSTPSPRSSHQSKQIFLLPGQLRGRQKLLASTIGSVHQSVSPNLDVLDPLITLELEDARHSIKDGGPLDGDTSIIADIERFKPQEKELSKTGYTALELRIMRAFKQTQLTEYLRQKTASAQYAHLRRGIKPNKKAKVSRIMLGIWGIVCLDEYTNAHDLLTHESVPLKDKDVFLLLSHNAHVLQYVARGGAKLSLASRDQGSRRQAQLQIEGTASQVHSAQVNIMSILGKASHTRMDLSLLMRLFEAKSEPYELHMVGRHTEMYFEPLGNDVYNLLTLSVGQVKRCKRLLLWMLDYVQHRRESLLIVGEGEFFPYVNEDALQWNMRGKKWNILRARTPRSHNNLLEADLDRFRDEKLQEQPHRYSQEIAEAKGHASHTSELPSQSADFDIIKVLQETAAKKHALDEFDVMQELQTRSDSHLNEEVQEFDLLQELESAASEKVELKVNQEFDEKSAQDARQDHVSANEASIELALDCQDATESEQTTLHAQEPEHVASSIETSDLSLQQIDTIYSQLVDFSYRTHLKGVADDKLNSPIFTVTLGNILYEVEGDGSQQPNEKSMHKFTSNVALANDKVLSLPLFDEPEPEIPSVRGRDPHTYALQIKFLPSPYPNEVVGDMKSEDQIKYPPVEMWIDLNTHAKADIDTLMLVLVEGENNCHVSLPESKADLKVCCQLSGDLLRVEDSDDATESESFSSDLESILRGTSQRYSRFNSQPGIAKFLEALSLDFSGKNAARIEAHVDLLIDGETVRYHHISTLYRRQLNFSYSNKDEEERMVQLNIVEGGALGGRRTEINFVGDVNGDISREEFGRLMLDSQQFVREL